MSPLSEWITRKRDQEACFLVLRLVHCRLHWWAAHVGDYTADIMEATAYGDREEAYRVARQVAGLLHLYERGAQF